MNREKIGQVITIILFAIFILTIIYVGTQRVERIDNGDMILVNQNEMDR